MNGSPAAACCVCHNASDWFYENISLLQSKHSKRSVSAMLKLIMGEELASDWSTSNTIMCSDCVDKINDYDEAFQKMQSIERELKQIHQNIPVKIEDGEVTAIAAGNVMEFDIDNGDFSSEDITDSFNEAQLGQKTFEMFVFDSNSVESIFLNQFLFTAL